MRETASLNHIIQANIDFNFAQQIKNLSYKAEESIDRRKVINVK